MKSERNQAICKQGLVLAFSLIAPEGPRDEPEREEGIREDSDPFDPDRRREDIDPSIPAEDDERREGPDDLEHRLPENPDERREDRDRGGSSPLDDMTIPVDPNGKNVG